LKNNFWQNLPPQTVGLAPLAGITDSPFRQLCRKYGADFVISEMVSAAGIYYETRAQASSANKRKKENKSLSYAFFLEKERPFIVQIFGHNPEQMATAAGIICAKFSPDGIDINMGCPVKKIMKTGSGAVLLDNPKLAVAITAAVKKAVGQIPLSVKTRLGVRKKIITNLAPQLEQAGADALIIHGRLQTNFFSGPVDHQAIRKVTESVNIPVFANGGVASYDDHKKLLDQTGARGTLIGQAACGNPFVFKQVKNPDYKPDWEETKRTILEHTKLQITFRRNEEFALTEMRKHYAWYIRGIKNAASWRQKLVRVTKLTEVESILDSI
jgi:tRNA-dihydrouridine synthase B